ncbi:uncharacterized protein [Bemisia tabaci]|uniref:uncharacterized protein n=1 Tax=Bemisia tabaci TaxID=7038 RepID=UPI003B2853EE
MRFYFVLSAFITLAAALYQPEHYVHQVPRNLLAQPGDSTDLIDFLKAQLNKKDEQLKQEREENKKYIKMNAEQDVRIQNLTTENILCQKDKAQLYQETEAIILMLSIRSKIEVTEGIFAQHLKKGAKYNTIKEKITFHEQLCHTILQGKTDGAIRIQKLVIRSGINKDTFCEYWGGFFSLGSEPAHTTMVLGKYTVRDLKSALKRANFQEDANFIKVAVIIKKI